MLGAGAEAALAEKRIFLRITVLGNSNSGKTSLINAFVNNVFYDKYQPTENVTLHYTTLSLTGSEDDPNAPKFNTLLEIEDTPGSEKMDKQELNTTLFDPWSPKPQDLAMARPPRDEKDKTKRRRSVDLPFSLVQAPVARFNDEGAPVDDTIHLGKYSCGRKELRCGPTQEQQCASCRRFQASLLPNGMYQPLVRQRMAYLFVFDANEQGSYLQALKRVKELQEFLTKRPDILQAPRVYLVGNKTDKDPELEVFKTISAHVKEFAREESESGNPLSTAMVSALQYRGVLKLFRTIVQDLRSREPLWKLYPLGDGAAGPAHEQRCAIQ